MGASSGMLLGIVFLLSALSFAYSSENYSIYSITASTFSTIRGVPFSTFGLQDALFSEGISYTWIVVPDYDNIDNNENASRVLTNTSTMLFTDACQQSDRGPNCTSICSKNALMFENMSNLHNCMYYPKIAALSENNSLESSALDIAHDLSIPASKVNLVDNPTTRSIRDCLLDCCADNDNLPGCNKHWKEHEDDYPSSQGDWDFGADGYELVSIICASLPAPVNSDIGGIGVWEWISNCNQRKVH